MEEITRISESDLTKLGPEALIIDVREPGEFAGERWPGSVNVPLSNLAASSANLPKSSPIAILCRSGRRSEDAARKMRALGFADVRVITGGLLGCKQPLEKGPGGVWAMERQVRMAAGSLVLLGAALGLLVHPNFWFLSAAVGAGLVFSAATDTCTMAMILAKLPWNKR